MSRVDDVMIRELRRIAGLQKRLFLETGGQHADGTAEVLQLVKDAILRIGRDSENPEQT